jgi:hypothetical protein
MFRRDRLHETEITESLIAAAQRASAHVPRLAKSNPPIVAKAADDASLFRPTG